MTRAEIAAARQDVLAITTSRLDDIERSACQLPAGVVRRLVDVTRRALAWSEARERYDRALVSWCADGPETNDDLLRLESAVLVARDALDSALRGGAVPVDVLGHSGRE